MTKSFVPLMDRLTPQQKRLFRSRMQQIIHRRAKTLQNGDRIRLAPGATMFVDYREWNSEAVMLNPSGSLWIGSLSLDGNRIYLAQAYNGKRRMNRAWMRKQCTMFLDSIAPEWMIASRRRVKPLHQEKETATKKLRIYRIETRFQGGISIYYAKLYAAKTLSKEEWDMQLSDWGESTNGGHSYGYKIKATRVKSAPITACWLHFSPGLLLA